MNPIKLLLIAAPKRDVFLSIWVFTASLFMAEIPANAVEVYTTDIVTRITLDHRSFDTRSPANTDFLDCPTAKGQCQSVAFPKVVADEKVILPKQKSLETLRFLTLKGLRVEGGDPVLTMALHATGSGDSIYTDLNNDENLGNDGQASFLASGDSCLTLKLVAGGTTPITVCRSVTKAKAWQEKCESITSAACGEAAFTIRVLDLYTGTFPIDGHDRRIALCDVDGDGKIRLDGGDRLVIDWDGDTRLEKSLDADGMTAPAGNAPFRFSVDSTTFELTAADEKGTWVELRQHTIFDPTATGFKAVEGRKAPDIRFVNLDGDTLQLSGFKGKKVLIHFWSPLCKPCLEDLSGLRDFHKGFSSKNWVVISLTADTDLGQVQQAALKHNMDWMVGMAGPEVRRYYASRPLPLNMKVDANGVLEKKDMLLGRRTF